MSDRVLVDTNIFIEIFRNKDNRLQTIVDAFPEVFINTMIYFELVRGEPGKRRYAAMEKYLSAYELLHLTEAICERSVLLMRKYRFSNGLDFPDALIAATCLEHDLYLMTKNRSDFEYIADLKII
ncbi:MAG: type II toxin-antitoxin system VapC family toxin [Acidobacteria bacterium]|nr:type II toxin-antitoxin system VapC family toxin [Acidobacteriota bacterium]